MTKISAVQMLRMDIEELKARHNFISEDIKIVRSPVVRTSLALKLDDIRKQIVSLQRRLEQAKEYEMRR